MKKVFITGLFFVCLSVNAQQVSKATASPQMKPMFNGKNFNGWHSFLTTKGVNNDPEKVFTIADGVLHVSGKEFGYLLTEKSYKDFHMSLEFKWGNKKWPPRDADTTKRDNGILFNVPADAKDVVWPKSIECQIQEGDVGDIWLIDSATVIVDGKRTQPKDYNRVQKKADGEHETGKWNKVEVISKNGQITYIVNGKVVNSASAPSVTEGKIAIQSEGAETFFRRIEIAEL